MALTTYLEETQNRLYKGLNFCTQTVANQPFKNAAKNTVGRISAIPVAFIDVTLETIKAPVKAIDKLAFVIDRVARIVLNLVGYVFSQECRANFYKHTTLLILNFKLLTESVCLIPAAAANAIPLLIKQLANSIYSPSSVKSILHYEIDAKEKKDKAEALERHAKANLFKAQQNLELNRSDLRSINNDITHQEKLIDFRKKKIETLSKDHETKQANLDYATQQFESFEAAEGLAEQQLLAIPENNDAQELTNAFNSAKAKREQAEDVVLKTTKALDVAAVAIQHNANQLEVAQEKLNELTKEKSAKLVEQKNCNSKIDALTIDANIASDKTKLLSF